MGKTEVETEERGDLRKASSGEKDRGKRCHELKDAFFRSMGQTEAMCQGQAFYGLVDIDLIGWRPSQKILKALVCVWGDWSLIEALTVHSISGFTIQVD